MTKLGLMTVALEEERKLLLRTADTIVQALGRMFAPCCEVVLHDLTNPEHAIVRIENPISGRLVGDSTTELGLRRLVDPDCPDVIQNYPTRFPDGRPAKSTSIGLKDSSGCYVASICLNLDLSMLGSVHRVLNELLGTMDIQVEESFTHRSAHEVRETLEQFAAREGADVRSLSQQQRRKALTAVADRGLLRLRGGVGEAAQTLGVSRATIYNMLNRSRAEAASIS